MRILDLFSGVGGERRRPMIEARGHELTTLDFNPEFRCTLTKDIFLCNPEDFQGYDFVFLGVPCEAFSVASISHHWGGGFRVYEPKTRHAIYSQKLVEYSVGLMRGIKPRYGWLMENPRGVLRKLPCVARLPRVTVTYCQYGDDRMKPTDLWGYVEGWKPRPMCKNRASCHVAAPRGARTGTQGIKGAAERAVVPWNLWLEILTCIERKESL